MTSLHIDDKSVRKGLLGRLLRIELEYDAPAPSAPASIIVKLHPAEEDLRRFVTEANLTEVRFYEEIAHTSELRTPRCYFSDIDESTGESVLMLEDLAGFRSVDEIPGCTLAETERITRDLARFHARWWSNPKLGEFQWLRPFDESFSVELVGTPASEFDGPLPDSVRAVGTRIRESYMELFHENSRPPRTIALNDIKARHVLFVPGSEDLDFAVIDFQMVVQGRGVLDLARLFGGSLDTELRRGSELDLLTMYHELLRSYGVEDYSFDDCLTDYRRGHLQNLTDLMAVEAQGLQQRGGDRAVQIQAVQLDRYAAAIVDLDCGDLLSA